MPRVKIRVKGVLWPRKEMWRKIITSEAKENLDAKFYDIVK